MSLIVVLEMLGTAAFAVSGALAASRKNMDIFGFTVLALMPAVGGGTLRDLILDRTPVFWVANPWYVAVALGAALAVFFRRFRPGGRMRLLVWVDALGLALFAALGTEISLEFGAGPLVAVMLGVTTGVAGGMIRDIICNEIPLIRWRSSVMRSVTRSTSAATRVSWQRSRRASACARPESTTGFRCRASRSRRPTKGDRVPGAQPRAR